MKLFFLMLFSSCMNNNPKFYDKVLNDFEGYSWFISINVKSLGYNGEVVIENAELFYCLNKTQKIEKQEYLKILKKKLENNLAIEIEDIEKYSFIKVPIVSSVEANSKEGLEKFINIYFNKGKVLKDGITDDERTVIIQKLFEWEIASKLDDETGYLVISR